jgi:hypothetical protein
LPPVKQGCELDSLDAVGDSEAKEQPVEVSFYRAARHFQLFGNFGVVAALQQQLDDLLFARSKPDRIIGHHPSCSFRFPCLKSDQLGFFRN